MNSQNLVDKVYRYVRLALPLMSKHKIPVTPENYAVWYLFVSGNCKELMGTIHQREESKKPFDEEFNHSLYTQFCGEKNKEDLKKLRSDLQTILTVIMEDIGQLNGATNKFGSVIQNSVTQLEDSANVNKIKDLMATLIGEVKFIGGFSKEIQQKLKDTNQQLEKLQKEFEKVKTESRVDFLTGIANRKAFDEKLEELTKQNQDNKQKICLLMMDIDHFKKFNDLHGHIIGDEVLKFVSTKIRDLIRGGDFFARFGGEEFVILLTNTPLTGARVVSENIREAFDGLELKAKSSKKKIGVITISIGVAIYKSSEQIQEFINRADEALYFAKNNGRNRVATELDL
jgi:diguanylate cyclase